MKKWMYFLLGLVSGVAATVLTLFIIDKTSNDDGMTLFKQPGECISTNDFKVLQVIGDNCALAYELNSEFGEMSWMVSLAKTAIDGGNLVLIINNNGEYYYDGQVIEVPKGKCMRQVGVYRYQTKNEDVKTVPIVLLTDK